MPLPTRSIAVQEAAAHLVERAEDEPAGRASDVAGPEVLTPGEMGRSWCSARGKRRWVVRLPLPGEFARGFREAPATVPDRAVGTETWKEWLGRVYGNRTPARR